MHGLTEQDSMMSVHQVPWHGLGNIVEEVTDIKDGLVKSGLGWTVVQKPLYIPGTPKVTEDGVEQTFVPYEGKVANTRSDTGAQLGIVGDTYEVFDNVEAFEFLDHLIGSEGHFETAGSLFGGRRIFVLVRKPEFVEIGGDLTATYIFVATSHDGSLAITAAPSNVRIVCNNTTTAAIGAAKDKGTIMKFRHTQNAAVRVEKARKAWDLTVDWESRFKELGDRLASEKMSKSRFETAVINKLFPVTDDSPVRERTIRLNAKEVILNNFAGKGPEGDTRGNSPGTKWCAFNAVTEFSDWQRRYTQKTEQVARSFEDTALKVDALKLVEAA